MGGNMWDLIAVGLVILFFAFTLKLVRGGEKPR